MVMVVKNFAICNSGDSRAAGLLMAGWALHLPFPKDWGIACRAQWLLAVDRTPYLFSSDGPDEEKGQVAE